MDSIKTGGGEAAMFRVLPVMRARRSLGEYTPLSSVILIRNSGQSCFLLIKLHELRDLSELHETSTFSVLRGGGRCGGMRKVGSEKQEILVRIKFHFVDVQLFSLLTLQEKQCDPCLFLKS